MFVKTYTASVLGSPKVTVNLLMKISQAACIACGIAMIIYGITVILVNIVTRPNSKLHKTNEYNHGHYSSITNKNKWFKPTYWLAASVSFTLNPGDSLWIPKHWWKWVKSAPGTVAVNVWIHDVTPSAKLGFSIPGVHRQSSLYRDLPQYLMSYTGPVTVWDSNNNKFHQNRNLQHFITDGIDGTCINTLDSQSRAEETNNRLFDHIRPSLTIPMLVKTHGTGEMHHTVWISGGCHDAGLHYDNSYGLLSVVSGQQHVTMFSPDESSLLDPISVIPAWASVPAMAVHYNLFQEVTSRKCKSKSFPSSRLLYESLMVYDYQKGMQVVANEFQKYGKQNMVFSVKQEFKVGGQLRWELYAYHFDKRDSNAPPASKGVLKMMIGNELNSVENVLVHSKDIYLRQTWTEVLSEDIHIYRALNRLGLPHAGYGHILHKDGTFTPESVYIIGATTDVRQKLKYYLDSLHFGSYMPQILPLLRKYETGHLAIFQMLDTNCIMIIYMGISNRDFSDFLEEFKYPPYLVKHVRQHLQRYADIEHEVAIEYSLATFLPVRTGFYGLL